MSGNAPDRPHRPGDEPARLPRADAPTDATTPAEVSDRLVRALAAALEQPEARVRERAGGAIAELLAAHVGELEQRVRRAERLALVGQLAASVVHELRNPLSVIETSAFIVAERARSDERVARHARRIAEQVAIAGGVISDLLEAARDRPLATAPTDPGALARAAVAQVPCPAGATVSLDVPAGLPLVRVDERRMRQVLTNLITNALEATDGRGRVVISARVDGRDDAAARVCLAVVDDGPGIAPEHLARLFDPLFTTKPQGTGLGLALSRDIVRAHGGELRASNDAASGRGARFEIWLPVATVPGGAGSP